MVSPVGPQNRVEGVLALQFPISTINRLMTADKQWEDAGMGESGETFLVGPDDLMRSDSRLFLENPEEFERESSMPERRRTSPMIPSARTAPPGAAGRTEATRQAQRGQTGTIIEDDYLGHETCRRMRLSTCPGCIWSIIAKIDTAEAFAPVATFTRTLVLSTAVIIFVVSSLRCCWPDCSSGPSADSKPVRSRSVPATTMSRSSPVARRFRDLTVAFNDMSRNLAIKEELLTEQRRENDRCCSR